MQTFNVARILVDIEASPRPWHEFLRGAALSVGLYRLRAGQDDPQQPHAEDEVYYVLAGEAGFRAGEHQQRVQAGTLLFVERTAEHRFFDVTEDLTLLVFFAPPEGSRADAKDE